MLGINNMDVKKGIVINLTMKMALNKAEWKKNINVVDPIILR